MEGILPLSRESATGTTMFIQGIGLAPVSVPLHTVYLCGGLVTGPVVVGAKPIVFLSREFSFFWEMIYIAGSKVISGLAVDNNPELTKDMDKLDSGLFPACAVTRAAARQAALQSSRTMQSE